jgi:hypothetical protein
MRRLVKGLRSFEAAIIAVGACAERNKVELFAATDVII